jgi:hypothetical protein
MLYFMRFNLTLISEYQCRRVQSSDHTYKMAETCSDACICLALLANTGSQSFDIYVVDRPELVYILWLLQV